MNSHPDAKLIELGRQFDKARAKARSLKRKWKTGKATFDAYIGKSGEAIELMKAIHREQATTVEGVAVKLNAVTFDIRDFDDSPRKPDVGEAQLIRLARQVRQLVTPAVSDEPSQLETQIAAYAKAREAWENADPEGEWPDSPEWIACDAAEHAIIVYPCQTMEDVRKKADFFLNNESAYETIRNCRSATEETLLPFLRSLLGEVHS